MDEPKYNFRGRKLITVCISLLLAGLLAVYLIEFTRQPEQVTSTFWLWRFLGRLHPLTVHFPIVLILIAALLEIFTWRAYRSPLRPAIDLLLPAGVITAAFSVVFGLFLSKDGDYGKDALAVHQWTGIATCLLGGTAWWLSRRAQKKSENVSLNSYRTILLFTALGVIIAGHYGASLAHGKDYLTATLPWSSDYDQSASLGAGTDFSDKDTAHLTPKQELELQVKVRAIFAHNCTKCHGPEKVKGDLRLDARNFVFKGGEKGPIVVPGNIEKSEIFRRITLPAGHKELMPSEGKKLSEGDVAVIRYWIKKGTPWPDGSDNMQIFRLAPLAPRDPSLPPTTADITNPIDRWTNQYFSSNKISWPALVDDRTYLKRISLDITGLLPSPEEFNSFIKDVRPDKRTIRVRELLNKKEDYAAHWLSFWNDLLRNDYTGTGYITGGRFEITDWLYKAIRSNMPYDRLTKELINPAEPSKGFIEGIKWRGVVNASQRTEMQAAQNVSQVFLGLNLKCTSCHNSFISDWKLEDAYAFADIFADSSLEINRCDKPTGKYTHARMLWKELGDIDSNANKKTRMSQLADNIVKPENGRFYRTIVNRVWAQLMGRGLVEPVDVMDNEPWDQDLLDWMATHFQQGGSDLRELIFLIATSKTYQLPSVGMATANDIVTHTYQFKGMVKKRMTGEQFSDAVSKMIEPVYPDSLMMYKPIYDSGYLPSILFRARASFVSNDHFLTALGRPNRETVTSRRETQANLLQALELTNGERLNSILHRGAEKWKRRYGKSDAIVREIYHRALLREPKEKELQVAIGSLGGDPSVDAIQDLFWSVVLLPEFQIIN